MRKSIIILAIFGSFAIAAIVYFNFNQASLVSDGVGTVSYELKKDEVLLLSFEMPSDYTIAQDLSTSLSFEADGYLEEGTLVSPSLKKCVESSNGMSASVSMNDRSFDPSLLPPEEFVEDRNTFTQNSSTDFVTSTEIIGGRIFSRAERIDPSCQYSYSVSYSGQVEGYITNIQFWFEGDYMDNLALINKILNSMDFQL